MTTMSRQDVSPAVRPALRRTPAWWRTVCEAAAGISLVFVTVLWLLGGGVQGLTSPAQGLTSLGRLTGLVSADLLLIQVLLMARIPLVERSYG
ncbi:MAG: hypothetical protein ABIO67_09150 [Mycobacteriales bacterium]